MLRADLAAYLATGHLALDNARKSKRRQRLKLSRLEPAHNGVHSTPRRSGEMVHAMQLDCDNRACGEKQLNVRMQSSVYRLRNHCLRQWNRRRIIVLQSINLE